MAPETEVLLLCVNQDEVWYLEIADLGSPVSGICKQDGYITMLTPKHFVFAMDHILAEAMIFLCL